MRFCVPIPCFFSKMPFDEAVHTVGKLGYDAAETYHWKGLIDPERTVDACKESGVEVMSLMVEQISMTDPSCRDGWLRAVEEAADFALSIGAKRILSQVGQDTGAPREEQHASIVEGLIRARDIVSGRGVTLMIEPLNTFVEHPGYYLTKSVEAFDIIREVDHPNIKMVYDIYHQQIMEGNIIPNITNNLDCIEHIHAAGHPGRHELQYGENDYRVIFAAVEKAGYRGACGLEYNPLMDPVESLIESKRIYG